MNVRQTIAVLTVSALSVVACGDDTSTDENAATTASTTTTVAPTEDIVIDEAFDDDDFNWLDSIATGVSETITIADGSLTFAAPGGAYTATATPYEPPNDDVIGDQRVEATVTIESPGVAFLECRTSNEDNDASRVQFYWSSAGGAGIDRVPADGVTDGVLDFDKLIELDSLDHGTLDFEDGATYDLALECTGGTGGDELTAVGYLDGEEIVRGTDPDPTPIGFGGIGADWSRTAAGLAEDDDEAALPAFTVSYDSYRLIAVDVSDS